MSDMNRLSDDVIDALPVTDITKAYLRQGGLIPTVPSCYDHSNALPPEYAEQRTRVALMAADELAAAVEHDAARSELRAHARRYRERRAEL